MDVFPSMFDMWSEFMTKRKSICASLICYESMTVNSVADNKPCLPEVFAVTRDFHVYSNYSVCWWLLVGPLGIYMAV